MTAHKLRRNGIRCPAVGVFPVLIAGLLGLWLCLLQPSAAKFSREVWASDAAAVAKFDVTITRPDRFVSAPGEAAWIYHFLSAADLQVLTFGVHNNGEIGVRCTPQVDGDIHYRVYVMGLEQASFVVGPGEILEFDLLIGPKGLDIAGTSANLTIDLQQEGGIA